MTAKVCILQGSDDFWSSSFVRAHIEFLQGEKVVLKGYYPDLSFNGRLIRYFYSQQPRLKKLLRLLPHWIYHKRVTLWEESFEGRLDAIAGFMQQQKVDVILAEFGIHGCTITPHAKMLGIPVVVHFHGHDAHRDPLLVDFLDRYRDMFDYASSVISVSRFMSDKLVRMGCPPEKIVFNPYGPRNSFFENRSSYDDVLLAIGRFTDIKAPHLTVLAFQKVLQQFPQATLIMGGHGELLEACQTLAIALGIEKNIQFLGPLRHEQVVPLLAKACAFVQHSVQPTYGDAEGTPVAILEAGAAGLPVVSTRHAGIQDAVIHGETGFLVEERDISEMADAMIRLLADKSLCRTMGAKAREHIRTNYNIDRHLSCIDGLLQKARSRAQGERS
jgi:colanic acid/amylovoran biosynthesis glycosyltransferase